MLSHRQIIDNERARFARVAPRIPLPPMSQDVDEIDVEHLARLLAPIYAEAGHDFARAWVRDRAPFRQREQVLERSRGIMRQGAQKAYRVA